MVWSPYPFNWPFTFLLNLFLFVFLNCLPWSIYIPFHLIFHIIKSGTGNSLIYFSFAHVFLDCFFRINDKWKYWVKEYKHSMKLVARLLLNKEIPVYKFTSTYNLPSNGYYFLIQVYGNMKGNIAMLFQFILPLLLVRLNICPCYFWWLIVFSSA